MTSRLLRAPQATESSELPPRFATTEAFEVHLLKDRGRLYSPGTPSDRVFMLRTGRVRLLRRGADGAPPSVHAILSAGDVFGGEAASVDGKLDEEAVASGDVEAWSFGAGGLQMLCEARPQLALELIRGLARRQRDMARRLDALTFKEVPARLAGQLLALADSIGEPSLNGGARDLRGVTQQDLADLVGASRSFVSTLVNDLKRDGVLASSGRTIVLRQPERLAALAALDRVSVAT